MYGQHAGPTADAVCDALRRRGIKVGPVVYAAAGFRAAYVVRLLPPGESWSVSVTYEEPVGRPVKTRWITVNNFKEVPDAADLLAKALEDDDPDSDKEVHNIANFGGTLDGWIGGGAGWLSDGRVEEGVAVGATGLIQYKWLDIGIGLTATGAVYGGSATLVSGLAGLRYDPVPWFRFDLLAESGAQTMKVADSGFLSRIVRQDSATLPYVGGRASVSFLMGRSHTFLIGMWFMSGSALGEKVTTATVESCLLGCSVSTETHTAGGPSFATGLRIGGFIH
jgi:hypothetical protein